MTAAESILAILDASTKRGEAAIPGPWFTLEQSLDRSTVYADDKDGGDGWTICRVTDPLDDHKLREKLANFIAAARTDLPRRDAALRVAVDDIDAAIQKLGNERSEVPRMIIADRLVYTLQKIAEILEEKA